LYSEGRSELLALENNFPGKIFGPRKIELSELVKKFYNEENFGREPF
jgi:hypothetical protein